MFMVDSLHIIAACLLGYVSFGFEQLDSVCLPNYS